MAEMSRPVALALTAARMTARDMANPAFLEYKRLWAEDGASGSLVSEAARLCGRVDIAHFTKACETAFLEELEKVIAKDRHDPV